MLQQVTVNDPSDGQEAAQFPLRQLSTDQGWTT